MLDIVKYSAAYVGTFALVFAIPLTAAYLFNVVMYLINTIH